VALAGAEGDARGARLEAGELAGVVAQALREDPDRTARTEDGEQTVEGELVRERPFAMVVAALHRHRPHRPQHGPQQRAAEEHVLGHEAHDASAEAADERRVEQRVGMVAEEDDGPGLGHVLEAHHLDAAKEGTYREAEQTAQQAVGDHGRRPERVVAA
jgi:hypothetical protein